MVEGIKMDSWKTRRLATRKKWSAEHRLIASSIEERAKKKCYHLLSELTEGDQAALLRMDVLQQKVWWYDWQSYSVEAPHNIPWPVIWLLSRAHVKTLYHSPHIPKAEVFRTDLDNFKNRLAWRHQFRNSTYNAGIRLNKPSIVPPCRNPLPADLEVWYHGLRQTITSTIARERQNTATFSQGKKSGLEKFALKLIADNNWLALPNDKDGGYALIHKTSLAPMEQRVFNNTVIYRWEDEGIVNSDIRGCKRATKKLCERIGKATQDDQIAAVLFRPFTRPGSTIVASLRLKVKSHKTAGNVKTRPLHCCVGYSLEGIARWLTVAIRARLRILAPHLIISSREARNRISTVTHAYDTKLVKVDLTDFYLSGKQDELRNDIMGVFDTSDVNRPLYADIIDALLYYQFVRGRCVPHKDNGGAYRTVAGSGMGLIASGDMSDAAYWTRIEKWATLPIILNRFKIKCYLRFRDDSLFVADDMELFYKFYSHLVANSRYFTPGVEDVSRTSMMFLELFVEKSFTGYFTARHAFKPTALHIPLSAHSGQPDATHQGWPRTVVKNIVILSTKEQAKRQILEYKCRLSQALVPFAWPSEKEIDQLFKPASVPAVSRDRPIFSGCRSRTIR